MRALDTKVLARFFVDDADADDAQAAKQRPAAIAALAERSFVSVTVLLELEWVLRGFYELPTRDIARVPRALASIEHITLEDRAAALVAVDAADQGLDFADALHLARSSRAAGFATFNQRPDAARVCLEAHLDGQALLSSIRQPPSCPANSCRPRRYLGERWRLRKVSTRVQKSTRFSTRSQPWASLS